MNFLSSLEAKRDGRSLSPETIRTIVADFVAERIPDYQMAAMLMAIFFRGLDAGELRHLTFAMRDSGLVLRWPEDSRPVVDKHSTGGVGDKVSLPLAPLLAALGFRVPMISGRGLGLTGGTLDKLESIPGLTTAMEPARMVKQVQELGVAMAGQSQAIVPADRLLYALRDVTGTVPSIPLITASILSKKFAEGLTALVMDVKCGSAAFMKRAEDAQALAKAIVGLATDGGVNSRAFITDMNSPLGHSAGNWLEVKEAVDCLEGHGPADVVRLVVECAASLLVQTGRAVKMERARDEARAMLSSDKPRTIWTQMIRAQGADLNAFEQKLTLDSCAPVLRELRVERAGHVMAVDARIVAEVVRDLGGGRLTKESAVNLDVGLDRLAKPGVRVERGETLCRVHALTEPAADTALRRLHDAFVIGETPPAARELILGVVER
jgi:pyrimidine-nucleoside phosphorylase